MTGDMYVRPDRDEIAAQLGITDYTRYPPLAPERDCRPAPVPRARRAVRQKAVKSQVGVPSKTSSGASAKASVADRCSDCGYLRTAPGHRLSCGTEGERP